MDAEWAEMAQPAVIGQSAAMPEPMTELMSRPILREQVAHALRAALVAGELEPGVLYSAPLLAARFGVSATPVREAMLDLVKEGLVETVRNKGFRIAELSGQKLDEITELRMLIEVPTTARLAGMLTPAQIKALRPLADAITAAASVSDLIGYIEADRRFHLELLGHAGNAHLVEVVGELRARARLYGLRQLAESGELIASAHEHDELLDLLAAGDSSGVADLMGRHIGHVRGIWAAPAPSATSADDRRT
jgi:DNA-binding GntR family transcriptional regulator